MPLFEYRGTRPILGKDVFVADNATVIGDVVLGDGANIWFSTVLRGDVYPIRIGSRTNIQDGSVVHVTDGIAKTTIGNDVTVGHMALLHGCTVGHRCLIGMGSILLDNCVIGDDCIVAAGSLVPPRMIVPSGMLVMGRPAKPVRQLTENDRRLIKEGTDVYVDYARTFMSKDVRRVDP